MSPKKLIYGLFILSLYSTAIAQLPFKVAERTELNPTSLFLTAAKWSPDGKLLAAAGPQYGSIWLYDFSAGKWNRLIEENGAGWDFEWSPDSRFIAYRANEFIRRRKQTTLKIISVANQEIRALTPPDRNFSTPRWISNNLIGYLHQNEFKTAQIIKAETAANIANASPRQIVLFSPEGLVVKPATQDARLFTEPVKECLNAIYSPAGETLLFEKLGGEIWLLPSETGTARKIANGEMPAWSPDGKFVIFANPRDDGHQITGSDILISDLTGANMVNLTQTPDIFEMRPDWSATGNQIVCDAAGKIILLKLAGD